MKNKFWYLTKNSLSRKVSSKWFKIVNILLCLLIVCALNIDTIISKFGGDFNKKTEVYIIDNTGIAYDVFNEQIKNTNALLNDSSSDSAYVISKYDKTLEEAKEEVKDSDDKIFIEFNDSEENILEINMLTKEYVDLKDYTVLTTALNNTKSSLGIIKYNIDPTELANIYKAASINRIYIEEGKNSSEENSAIIITTVFPVLILPFFMLSLLLVQMIGAEVNDEKTTRGMEIIISNVDPKTHLASKIVAGNVFVLFQSLLLVAYALLAMGVRIYTGGNLLQNGLNSYITGITTDLISSSFIDKLSYIIPLVLVLILLTFLAYSLLAGILASMSTNIEDFQQLQTPIMILSLAGFYLSMLAGFFKGSLFIRIVSYIPFLSAILSPSLLVLDQIGIIDVFISIAIMILVLFLLFKYGIRIYKVGILNYSSKDLWKRMFKAMKN